LLLIRFRLPVAYHQEAAELAFKAFKDKLQLETVEDVVFKRAIYSSVNLCSLNAEFDRAHWKQVMSGSNGYGSTIEVAVFKAKREEDEADDCTLNQGVKGNPVPPAPPTVLPYIPPASPYASYAQLPGIAQPIKTMQMRNAEDDQTAVLKVPETYEACESVARQIFQTSSRGEPTSFVLRVMIYDPLGMANWAIVHPTAYESSILKSYASPLNVRVEFETEKQKEEKVRAIRKAKKARRGFFQKLFGRKQVAPGPRPLYDQNIPY